MDETTPTSQEAPAPPLAAPLPDQIWLLLERAAGMADGEYTVAIGAGLRLHTVEPRPFAPAVAQRIVDKYGTAVREATPADFERLGLPVPATDRPARCSACEAEAPDLRNGFCPACAAFRPDPETPARGRKTR